MLRNCHKLRHDTIRRESLRLQTRPRRTHVDGKSDSTNEAISQSVIFSQFDFSIRIIFQSIILFLGMYF